MDIYARLAKHLAALGMGYPEKDELLDILRENFTLAEAEVALAIPSNCIPFEPAPVSQIAQAAGMSEEETSSILVHLADRGLIFSTKQKCYSLQQFGYGFPQTFFWKGADTPFSRKMAAMIVKYARRKQLLDTYGATKTKAFRYVPAYTADPDQHAVFPFEMMEELIDKVRVIALAHCPCRMTMSLVGKKQCNHELEVCMKYDDLAEYLIERGMGREITREEAKDVARRCADAGLVHLVDNAREGIRHTCNCCGCCCWSVGSIRKRSIQRDVLMATYFLRETKEGECTGCGACIEVCPVQAVHMEDGLPVADREWCIGCGVCACPCPTKAVVLVRKSGAVPPKDFRSLHERILKERKS
jgi:Pyruvate/2-oxoacid:ferredoxin oxidoreductase delta subunit